MSRPFAITTLIWALSFGGLVAVLTGERRAVSLRIWLASLVVWFAFASVRRLVQDVPLIPARIRSLISIRRRGVVGDSSRLREIRALEGLLLRAKDNERAYVQQLQPRVVELARHFLPVSYGIDYRTQPERVALLLGPLAWMVDGTAQQRTPTLEELDAFLDVLIPASPTRTGEDSP